MSKKYRLLILLVSLLSISVVVVSLFYVKDRVKLEEVYVAKYDLTNRSKISEEEIEMLKMPTYYLNENVIRNKEDIVGKYVKISTIIPKGSFFYDSAIENILDAKDGINASLLEGEVSYDISVNDIEINQAYLQKGMYIDLYLTVNKEKVDSDLLINNLRILGLFDVNNKEIKDYDNSSMLGKICLAVPKECVSYLNKAKAVGELNGVVGENMYNNVISTLNKKSSIFNYLD